MKKIHLRDIAHARSGDKGSSANVGVIAYNEAGYRFLVDNLTIDKVKQHFECFPIMSIERFELPNLLALNFVLHGVLGEGASRSLRTDAQGKALGQALLELRLDEKRED